MPWQHAIGDPRGSDIAVAVGRDKEGRFGVMFKKLAAFAPPDDLLRGLAEEMHDPGTPDLDNPDVPGGFTFLGQFIDHDMTLDTTPLSEQQQDPHATTNFDTPHFDLGSVYGKGPQEQPELYDPEQPDKLRFETPNGFEDIPRRPDGTAIIGDARNDENLIVCQLHIAFMKFHNTLVDQGHDFEDARRLTRWHFQWIIVHDFLPHVVGQDVVDRFLQQRGNAPPNVKREFYKPKNPNRPMMPIEYAVAAYRFGHSMVRPGYAMNSTAGGPIFGDPPSDNDLHGSRPIPARLKIDFQNFFEIPGVAGPPRNRTRQMDTGLATGLFHLPVPQVVPPEPAPPVVSLAERNLLRGKRLGLAAGQDVAEAMGVQPIGNDELGLADAGWNGKAPLWYYVLAEAERQRSGRRLGEVGGRIVAEVILGILDADHDSYLHAPRGWQPATPSGEFRMGDLLRFAGAA
ncbi:MAG: peroxidase family protein [Pseudonocardiaceae bacterium]